MSGQNAKATWPETAAQPSAAGTPGRLTLDSRESVRSTAQRSGTVDNRAQYRMQLRIDGLLQRISRLEGELVSLAHSEQQARHRAHHDALTGLPNRALLQDRLAQAVFQAQRSRKLVAVLLLDLDGFKRVNDELGHAAGDQLLQAVAARLTASIRAADTACRHGGDEFVIMLPEVDDATMLYAVLAKVHAHLLEPHVIDGHEVCISASSGTALYPTHGINYEQLMKRADVAMYLAKAASNPVSIEAQKKQRQEAGD